MIVSAQCASPLPSVACRWVPCEPDVAMTARARGAAAIAAATGGTDSGRSARHGRNSLSLASTVSMTWFSTYSVDSPGTARRHTTSRWSRGRAGAMPDEMLAARAWLDQRHGEASCSKETEPIACGLARHSTPIRATNVRAVQPAAVTIADQNVRNQLGPLQGRERPPSRGWGQGSPRRGGSLTPPTTLLPTPAGGTQRRPVPATGACRRRDAQRAARGKAYGDPRWRVSRRPCTPGERLTCTRTQADDSARDLRL